jgi:hypothetical protein
MSSNQQQKQKQKEDGYQHGQSLMVMEICILVLGSMSMEVVYPGSV